MKGRLKNNLTSNHVNHLTQYVLKKNRFLSHALHSMQLLLVEKLQFIPCQNSISIQINTLKPNHDKSELKSTANKNQLGKFSNISLRAVRFGTEDRVSPRVWMCLELFLIRNSYLRNKTCLVDCFTMQIRGKFFFSFWFFYYKQFKTRKHSTKLRQ